MPDKIFQKIQRTENKSSQGDEPGIDQLLSDGLQRDDHLMIMIDLTDIYLTQYTQKEGQDEEGKGGVGLGLGLGTVANKIYLNMLEEFQNILDEPNYSH